MFKSQVEPASGFTAKFWTFYGVIIWSKGKVRMELALVSVKKAHVLYLTSFLLSLLLWVMAYGQSANGNLDSYCKNQTKQKRQWKAIRKSMAGGGGGGGGVGGGGEGLQNKDCAVPGNIHTPPTEGCFVYHRCPPQEIPALLHTLLLKF